MNLIEWCYGGSFFYSSVMLIENKTDLGESAAAGLHKYANPLLNRKRTHGERRLEHMQGIGAVCVLFCIKYRRFSFVIDDIMSVNISDVDHDLL